MTMSEQNFADLLRVLTLLLAIIPFFECNIGYLDIFHELVFSEINCNDKIYLELPKLCNRWLESFQISRSNIKDFVSPI